MRFTILAFLLCTTFIAPASANNHSPLLKIIKTDYQRWHFSRLQFEENKSDAIVSGRLTASSRYGLPKGHIDIAVWSDEGDLMYETTTNYFPPSPSKRAFRKGGVRFSASVPKAIPTNAVIKIAYHQNQLEAASPPKHESNIAR